ncbi:AMP-binding protein [Streptomyces sp. NBC_01716]
MSTSTRPPPSCTTPGTRPTPSPSATPAGASPTPNWTTRLPGSRPVLADSGTTQGDRVASLGLNSSAILVTMLAAFRISALSVPVNFRLAESELASVLERSGTEVIVCQEGHRTGVEALRARTRITRFLLADDDPEAPTEGASGRESWSPLISAAAPTRQVPSAHRRPCDPDVCLGHHRDAQGRGPHPRQRLVERGERRDAPRHPPRGHDLRRRPLFHIGALNSFAIRTLVRGGAIAVLPSSLGGSAVSCEGDEFSRTGTGAGGRYGIGRWLRVGLEACSDVAELDVGGRGRAVECDHWGCDRCQPDKRMGVR